MIRISSLFLYVFLMFSSCEGNKKKNDSNAGREGFVVEGYIENGRGSVLRIGKFTGSNIEIVGSDTADENGFFRMEGFQREKFLAVLNFNVNKKIFLVIDTNSKIKLTIPEKEYDFYKVEGSRESQELRNIRELEYKYGKEMTVIREKYQSTTNENELKRLDGEAQRMMERANRDHLAKIRLSDDIMVQLFGHYILQLNIDDSTQARMYRNAKSSGLSSSLVKQFISEYEQKLITAIGQPAPEISLQDTLGNVISLSSLKGKVVLVDFWASWCQPCRMENPNVSKVYRKYKNQGFEIYGVSLDDEDWKWRTAINEDGINWLQVRDAQNMAGRLYAVTTIPATFLIDREGKIVARNLRGDDLEKKVRQYIR